MKYQYNIYKTERNNSFIRSIIQATTKEYSTKEDIKNLIEDIANFFSQKISNLSEEEIFYNIYNKDYKGIKLININHSKSPDSIKNIYFQKKNAKNKDVFFLISKSFSKHISYDSFFVSAFDMKYFKIYLEQRFKLVDGIKTKKYIDFIYWLIETYPYDIVNDILDFGIIILDQNLKYLSSYPSKKENNDDEDKEEKKEYIILKQDYNGRYSNVYFTYENENIYIVEKDGELYKYLTREKDNTKEYYIAKRSKLDYILEKIENSDYSEI